MFNWFKKKIEDEKKTSWVLKEKDLESEYFSHDISIYLKNGKEVHITLNDIVYDYVESVYISTYCPFKESIYYKTKRCENIDPKIFLEFRRFTNLIYKYKDVQYSFDPSEISRVEVKSNLIGKFSYIYKYYNEVSNS